MPESKHVGKYAISHEIGRGTYGKVYKGKDTVKGIPVAVKKIYGATDNGEKEAELLKLCIDAAHIVQLLDTVRIEHKLYLVFECLDSDLGAILKGLKDRNSTLSTAQVKRLLRILLMGVKELHERNILHRDLKPNNFLVATSDINKFIAKIGDFGMAKFATDDGHAKSLQVVTRSYRAPELFFGDDQYGKAIDLWSVGCIFAEMLLNEPLFDGSSDIDQLSKIFAVLGSPSENNWKEASHLPFYLKFKNMNPEPLRSKFQYLSEEGVKLMNSMLQLNPKKRISAAEALIHPYFQEDLLPTVDQELSQLIPPSDVLKRRRITSPEAADKATKIHKCRRLL